MRAIRFGSGGSKSSNGFLFLREREFSVFSFWIPVFRAQYTCFKPSYIAIVKFRDWLIALESRCSFAFQIVTDQALQDHRRNAGEFSSGARASVADFRGRCPERN